MGVTTGHGPGSVIPSLRRVEVALDFPGTRPVILPASLRRDLRWHLDSFAEPGPHGLLFVREEQAPFRRSTFGRKWRRAREFVGMPDDFRFYDLRHTGHTLSPRSGTTLKDTMVEIAAGLDAAVRKARQEAAALPDDAVDPDDQPSGTDLARGN
jgi:integrase